MRSPVYRNLDKPFQIYGFRPLELVALSVLFVLSGELTDAFHIPRIWVSLFTLIFALALYLIRRSLGDFFSSSAHSISLFADSPALQAFFVG